MNKHDLNKKRLEPCVAEIYANAIGPTTECYPQSFDTWSTHGVWAFYLGENTPSTVVPMDCYFIEKDTLKNIVTKWCKGLKGYWYYTLKLNYDDPEYKERKEELESFRKFEEEVSKDKSLTYAQRAAKIKKEALSHNFIWRSRDKEYIDFNIHLGVSPNSNKDWVYKNHEVYKAIEDAASTGKIRNIYVDLVHENEFVYVDEDGKSYRALIEEVGYYHENGRLVRMDTPGHKNCNLYDINNDFVKDLWDYETFLQTKSAESMEIMISTYKPVVIETLESKGHTDIAKWLEKSYMDKDLKQCFAVWIMKQWYLAEKDNIES